MSEFFHIAWEIILDGVLDALKALPFLFGAYLLIEFLEHKAGDKLSGTLQKMGRFGPVGGAVLGCVPQCGFSVAASNLYAGRLVTAGTLIAVFLSTSDQAVPILLTHPEQIGLILKLLLIKIILAVIAGFAVDLMIKLFKKNTYNSKNAPCEEICADCDCEHNGIVKSAFHHTVGIFIFILIINLVMNTIMTVVGEDAISSALMQIKWLQPIIAGIVGLIPNCAVSVVITELYLQGGLTFGSLVAGLSTGAGLGIVVLFKTNKHTKQNVFITLTTLGFGILAGFVVDILAFA